jgi:hypothetical protein
MLKAAQADTGFESGCEDTKNVMCKICHIAAALPLTMKSSRPRRLVLQPCRVELLVNGLMAGFIVGDLTLWEATGGANSCAPVMTDDTDLMLALKWLRRGYRSFTYRGAGRGLTTP